MKEDKSLIRIAMVDDHVLLRDALAEVIESFENCTVTIRASHGEELIQQISGPRSPDLVLLDINMPVMDGYETATWLKSNRPDTDIIVLTMFDSEIALIRLLQSGVKAFLRKNTHPKELNFAIKSVRQMGYYFSQNPSGKLANALMNPGRNVVTQPIILSDNEITFLRLSSTEMTYKEIAREMYISPRTVDNYRDQLFDKLNIRSRVGLAMYAIRNGMVGF